MTRKKKLPEGERVSCYVLLLIVGLWLCTVVEQVTTTGSSEVGSCYRLRKKDGSCGHVQRHSVTREDCCSGVQRRGWSSRTPSNVSSSSFSSESLSTSYSVLTCLPCATLCKGVKCGEDRKCVVRCGAPRCVCSPQCHLKHKEPICGSDGRTYSSECHLLKRACRKKKRVLVAHYGPCQTCSGVRCRGKKQCVLDEQMTPICIKCPSECPKKDKRLLCAADGRTYTSRCQLKQASCRAGSLIPRAYMGPCRSSPTCDSVRCWGNQTCLTTVETGQPQCTECDDNSCRPSTRPVCASDGRTYPSWCAFRHEACRSGRALTPALHQHCAANHTKADDCKPSKAHSSSGRKSKKHKSRQQELEEHQIEELLQRQVLMKHVQEVVLGEDSNNPSIMDGGGGSGQQLPEESIFKEKGKKSKRKKKSKQRPFRMREKPQTKKKRPKVQKRSRLIFLSSLSPTNVNGDVDENSRKDVKREIKEGEER
ncbi:LOW QUALITY PROTEIN: follistatin [Palaemon carinicauda]|uniref:LOW QUALITY PROTEIN: follistatin n=1 Tax=Palaemon carinicauda TaxID=392227 RepID=UPI0035B60D32